MPLIVRRHDSLDTETAERLVALYDHSPEFGSGEAALTQLQTALGQGTYLYIGWFNDKPIAAIWSQPTDQANARLLRYIVVHPANRGRGIADQLVAQAVAQDKTGGIAQFSPGCGAIRKLLTRLDA